MECVEYLCVHFIFECVQAAYLIPVINMLLEQGVPGASFENVQTPQVLIIAPTRELAIQIHVEACKFSHNSVLRPVIIYGGTVTGDQRRKLSAGCNILVATPGRLKDFTQRNILDFSQIKFLILDEADRMLDMGFADELNVVLQHPTMTPKVSGVLICYTWVTLDQVFLLAVFQESRQTLMFSATFTEEVQRIASNFMKAEYVFVNTGQVGGTNPDVHQEFVEVARNEKRTKLMEILKEIGNSKVIIFVECKKNADFLASFLCNHEISVIDLI